MNNLQKVVGLNNFDWRLGSTRFDVITILGQFSFLRQILRKQRETS